MGVVAILDVAVAEVVAVLAVEAVEVVYVHLPRLCTTPSD